MGDQGNSIIPFIILIDLPSHKGSVADIVDTLAHECMHKQNGAVSGFVDYYFGNETLHNPMYSAAADIGTEYAKDPTGSKCGHGASGSW